MGHHLPFPIQGPECKLVKGAGQGKRPAWWSGLPLPRNGDPTLVPAHVVVGGPKADAAEADGLLAVLAVVAWQRKRREGEKKRR